MARGRGMRRMKTTSRSWWAWCRVVCSGVFGRVSGLSWGLMTLGSAFYQALLRADSVVRRLSPVCPDRDDLRGIQC